MAKSQPRAPQTVVKQEENESALRWIDCKALLADIWKKLPAVPSVASRHAWATAHGVDPSLVHKWFGSKKKARVLRGTRHHPDDDYTLLLEKNPEEQPSSSTSLDPVPPLENPSSPSYLPMSSPPPQTPLDMDNSLPYIFSSGNLFDDNQTVDPSSLGVSNVKSYPLAPRAQPSEVDLTVKTEILDTILAPGLHASENGKNRRVILRVASDKEEGSSKRPRKKPVNSKPTPKSTQSKKKRQSKKAPKVEQVDQEVNSALQEHPTLDRTNPMMAFPQSLPPGFCVPPYFTYANPAMNFGAGMNGAQNLPPHSFGPMMYNPFTGAPLFNNMPAQFSNFSGQPNQPTFFNGNPHVGHSGQMNPQIAGPSMPGPSANFLGNVPMDPNAFIGNFQGFQPDMPANGGMNIQNPPDPAMSMMDFLNEPLDAGWSYT